MIRANDENNDWIFGIGVNAYKSGNLEVAQDIKTKLQEWKGDCFFKLDAGIDWLNRFADSNTPLLEEEIKSVILKVDGVVGVDSLVITLINRSLIIDYSVQTVYNEITDSFSI